MKAKTPTHVLTTEAHRNKAPKASGTCDVTSRVLEDLVPETLRPHPRNARTHSRKQIKQIARSIERFGFTNPVLIDGANLIIAGHGRVGAALHLQMKSVPCLRVDHLSPAEIRAYMIADNQIALNAGWDEELLGLELKELQTIDPDLDLELTGFSIAEVDHLIESGKPTEPNDPVDDRLPEDLDGPPRCRSGDIYRLGDHRLICGDARDHDVVAALMDGERAQMVFTDPPYNVPIAGHVSGLGRIQHREFAMASGEMSAAEFVAFLNASFRILVEFSLDGSIHFICMDWRHLAETQAAAEGIYAELKNLIVWVKDNGGMGTFYRSRHELIFAFKNGTAPHINSFELGQHGRYRTNVWEYKGVNTRKAGRGEELSLHPTVKPVAMIADAIRDVSGRSGLVLDRAKVSASSSSMAFRWDRPTDRAALALGTLISPLSRAALTRSRSTGSDKATQTIRNRTTITRCTRACSM
jgi:DNA modification methylase